MVKNTKREREREREYEKPETNKATENNRPKIFRYYT